MWAHGVQRGGTKGKRMAAARGAIYECSNGPDEFPPLVVVLMDGKVLGCQPVLSIQEGEVVLAEMMEGLTAMAAQNDSGAQI